MMRNIKAIGTDDVGVLKELLGLGGEERFCFLKKDSQEGEEV